MSSALSYVLLATCLVATTVHCQLNQDSDSVEDTALFQDYLSEGGPLAQPDFDNVGVDIFHRENVGEEPEPSELNLQGLENEQLFGEQVEETPEFDELNTLEAEEEMLSSDYSAESLEHNSLGSDTVETEQLFNEYLEEALERNPRNGSRGDRGGRGRNGSRGGRGRKGGRPTCRFTCPSGKFMARLQDLSPL